MGNRIEGLMAGMRVIAGVTGFPASPGDWKKSTDWGRADFPESSPWRLS